MSDPGLTGPVTFAGRDGEKVTLAADYGSLVITGNCAALEGDAAQEFTVKAAEILDAAQEREARLRAQRLDADLAAAEFDVLGSEATVCCVAHRRVARWVPAPGWWIHSDHRSCQALWDTPAPIVLVRREHAAADMAKDL